MDALPLILAVIAALVSALVLTPPRWLRRSR